MIQKYAGVIVVSMLLIGLYSCQEAEEKNCQQSMIDERDGREYCTIDIGSQLWMAENLQYTTDSSYSNPNNPSDINRSYGRLYTFEEAKQVCPPGWHLPSDQEWKTLEAYLGIGSNELDNDNWRGLSEGAQLKSPEDWQTSSDSNATGNNMSGFNALPAGNWNPSYGPYFSLGEQAFFWTSTVYDSTGGAWIRRLSFDNAGIERTYFSQSLGFSCRCVKD